MLLTGSNNYAGMTIVSGGTLELGLAAQSPILSGGGVDIQGSHTVFDYTNPGNDPANTILAQLTNSYDGGAWDIGRFKSSTHTSSIGLGWKDDAIAQKVTVQRALYGDVTLDGSVNASDLSIELANYGGTGTWATGDFNYDGQVNASDLALLLSAYGTVGGPSVAGGQTVVTAGVSPVPEPGTIVLLGIAALGVLGYAWRRRAT